MAPVSQIQLSITWQHFQQFPLLGVWLAIYAEGISYSLLGNI